MNNNGARSRITGLFGGVESRFAKQPAGSGPSTSDADAQRLIHELEVRQVELERQNEQLRQAGAQTDAAKASVIRDAQGRFVSTRSTLTDMTFAGRLEHELAEHSQRIRELSHRLIAVQEEERRRLAVKLHDSSSPLSAVAFNLGMIAADLAPSALAAFDSRLADTRALLADAIASIRDTCADLRPAMLDYAGLPRALQGHAELFSRRTGIAVEVSCTDRDRRLAPDRESCLFRIAQEALTNAAKHAKASAIAIELVYAAGHIVLTVSDNGVGFDPRALGQSEYRPGLGLLTMRERAEFAGGNFSLESEPGKGTRISVDIWTVSGVPGVRQVP